MFEWEFLDLSIVEGGDTAFLSHVRGASNPGTEHHVFEDQNRHCSSYCDFCVGDFILRTEEEEEEVVVVVTYVFIKGKQDILFRWMNYWFCV